MYLLFSVLSLQCALNKNKESALDEYIIQSQICKFPKNILLDIAKTK